MVEAITDRMGLLTFAPFLAQDLASHLLSASQQRNQKCTHLPAPAHAMIPRNVFRNGYYFMSGSCETARDLHVPSRVS